MWIHVRSGNTAFNLDHVTRMFVEETGSGAALKGEIAGKTLMIGYFTSKADAQAALEQIMQKSEEGASVYRI